MVAALRTETEMAVWDDCAGREAQRMAVQDDCTGREARRQLCGQRGPEADTGLLHANSL